MEKVSIRGRIHAINPTEQRSQTFKTRDFVIKTEGQYPQFIKVQLTQDKCGLLDNAYKIGQDVEAFYNLRGREVNKNGTTQYYNTIECWRLVSLQDEHHAAKSATYSQEPTHGQEFGHDINDDLAF